MLRQATTCENHLKLVKASQWSVLTKHEGSSDTRLAMMRLHAENISIAERFNREESTRAASIVFSVLNSHGNHAGEMVEPGQRTAADCDDVAGEGQAWSVYKLRSHLGSMWELRSSVKRGLGRAVDGIRDVIQDSLTGADSSKKLVEAPTAEVAGNGQSYDQSEFGSSARSARAEVDLAETLAEWAERLAPVAHADLERVFDYVLQAETSTEDRRADTIFEQRIAQLVSISSTLASSAVTGVAPSPGGQEVAEGTEGTEGAERQDMLREQAELREEAEQERGTLATALVFKHFTFVFRPLMGGASGGVSPHFSRHSLNQTLSLFARVFRELYADPGGRLPPPSSPAGIAAWFSVARRDLTHFKECFEGTVHWKYEVLRQPGVRELVTDVVAEAVEAAIFEQRFIGNTVQKMWVPFRMRMLCLPLNC